MERKGISSLLQILLIYTIISIITNSFRKGNMMKSLNKFLILSFFIFSAEAQSETLGELITNKIEKIQKGNIGLIDSYNKRIIEIDNTGKVIWETKIPKEFKKAYWTGGADIEWLSNSDTFLIAAPRKGFFEINRKGEILNSCKTKFISHDIDKLDNGSFIFVNGWDEKGKKEPILSRVSNNCKILMSKSEDFFKMNKADLQPRFAKDRANLHANAVRILEDKSIMVSVRNYDQVVIIKNNKIIKRFKKARGVHDPSNVYAENGKSFFYYLNRGRPQSINKRSFDNVESKPKKLWSSTGGRKSAWTPLRTLEKLKNRNWLITGSQKIGQVTTDGELVWELYFPEFRHQKDKNKDKTYIYKVTFITKQS